ncbi:LacI family DNA-binding transcriptional regulator [Vibrio astriarenae]|uniref:LacI family DNA-binding transcriptional regulator n=1 Tax=Vibrio agarivorans TaxID=153622 RepID=A0ABT7Y2L4_9VIBR|nr:LacI family DNA-binding transcriptional regulator [Vibrio agarivorans]MDN2482289.1 LacI family DNA-binding transcriptional regulator [Vibrio agarivorans]MDN3661828.1 LacI family DNA-binding transcriptional regulator [Vibrio agarivorans]
MATIKDVSEQAGVSQATVSRVINGTSRVSHDKKLKVEKAIKDLGYRPNSIAQALASSRSGSIGVIVPELGGPFYSSILHCIEEKLRQFGYHVIVTAGGNTEKEQRESVEFLLSRRVDALIMHCQQLTDDYLINLEDQGIISVLVNRFVPELKTSCINIDNEHGAELVTDYLIEMGHKKIACITGPLDKSDARGRLQGYRNALENAGIEYDESLVIESGFTEETGISATHKLLRRGCEFTALFAGNDHMAAAAAEVLTDAGYRVPQDISLVGFDDVLFARYLTPSLTTVNFPIEQMSIEAVQLTIQKLHKNKQDVNFRLSPKLVIRDSVNLLPTTL